ncbi:MAG: alpha/beta hydrolase [Proteobacteria bacterium]|nr:MAG: alpha/beta hydrolase [Pseudomonadota bacterium]
MALLEREDGKIFYQVQGEGEPLLMLRGLGRSSRYWLGFDKLMANYFQVITIDQRGLGRSTQDMGWTDDIDTLADDCLAVLDHLSIKKFHIFGLSLGGMIATAMAAKRPTAVLSLAIAASSSADYYGFRLHPLALPKLLIALRAGKFQDALMELVVPPTVLRSWGPEIQSSWQEILDKEGFPLTTVIKQLRASLTHRIRDRLESGTYPVLFVHGSMDSFVPQANSSQLNRHIARSKLAIIKGAGHEIALGYEHELAKLLRTFTSAKA